MRMPSLSSTANRTTPKQDRASRRLQSLLDAAAEIFAKDGYEATTMTEIAGRSGTSIGGLYRYFPDKRAVAQALLRHYSQHAESYWVSLIQEARELPVNEFADLLLDRMEEFVSEHPAYLILNAAPIKFAKDAASRRNLRIRFSEAVQAKKPSLTPERAMLIANIVLQIIRGMMVLYAEGVPRDRPQINAEFKRLLANYLGDVLGQEP
jgi:AcrR family transcriptional regulator